jgi:hypothetical protein
MNEKLLLGIFAVLCVTSVGLCLMLDQILQAIQHLSR